MFVQLFCETFGPDKAEKLYVQYPFNDIYGNRRFIDFALVCAGDKFAIEIDGERYHNPKLIPVDKYTDDLLKKTALCMMTGRFTDGYIIRLRTNLMKSKIS